LHRKKPDCACSPCYLHNNSWQRRPKEEISLHHKFKATMERLLSIPLAVLVISFAIANGQEIVTDKCACSPRSYEFTLDFSLTCPPVNITIDNSIEATSCIVSPFGDPSVEDFVPVYVEDIDVLELGQNLRVEAQTDIEGILYDGDKFTYTSIVADPDNIMDPEQIPRALQINIFGINAQGGRIINVFIVTFTNDCGSYPLFQEGQSAGWIRFTDISPGSPELCSAAPPIPDLAPVSPTVSPVDSPVEATPTGNLVPPSSFIAPTISGPTAFPMQRLTPTLAPTVEITEKAVVPSGGASGSKETGAPSEEADPVTTGAPIEPAEPDTNSPTPEPIPGTVAPVAEKVSTDAPVAEKVSTDAPVEIEEDDMDLPTMSEFMSMSMSMDVFGRNLLETLAEPRTREFEFGEWRAHRNTKDVRDKKSEKSGNMLKYLKTKVDKDKSTKVEKALKGIKVEEAEKDAGVVRIAKRLRNGSSRLRA